MRREALRIAAIAIAQRFNADHSDGAEATLACACGHVARRVGRREKTFLSALGELSLSRAYYHCATCNKGSCPRDRALGLEATSLSPAVTRMVGLVASMNSFKESSELMRELAGVRVDAKQVERTAEGLGVEIAEDERRFVEPLEVGLVAPRFISASMALACRCARLSSWGARVNKTTARARRA